MLIVNKRFLLPALALLLNFGANSVVYARPSMWWDHFEAATSDASECVKQAERILTTEKSGESVTDADSVRSWSEKTVAVAECITFGGQLIVAVLISSEDPDMGNRLYNALRIGLKKSSPKP
jgi:hypothetical protein